jgi:very-short-patch-repair endonuclease
MCEFEVDRDAEQQLHARIIADAELGPLFRFNQIIKTKHGTTPRVDVVWLDGKLVIEIDGHRDHARAGKFCYDRERDYQLLLSGYRVMRVPEMFVLMDAQLTLERIRSAVRYLRQENHGL